MNYLKICTKIFSCLHTDLLPVWIYTPFRRVIRKVANKKIPEYLLSLENERIYCGRILDDVIITFTSFPTRIEYVWIVVRCMKHQTVLPHKIILWLSKKQFPDEIIPQNLLNEIDNLFEVKFVDEDIRSHKKYYYASKAYPGKYLFLIDDDIFYPANILERTWEEHLKDPASVICNYGYRIGYNKNGGLRPYNSWRYVYNNTKGYNLFFGSGGGTLISPSKLYEDFLNIDLARNLTPIADDIWLNAMTKLAGIPCHMLDNGPILPIIIPSNQRLTSLNLGECQNDKQIKSICEYYKKEIGIDPFSQRI